MSQTNLRCHHADDERIGILRNDSRSKNMVKFFFSIKDIYTDVCPVRMTLGIKVNFTLRAFAAVPGEIDNNRLILISFLQKTRMCGKIYCFMVVCATSRNGEGIFLTYKRP